MSRILNYPAGIGHDLEVNPGWIEFSIYERKSPANSVPKQTINLYLPSQMNNPNTIAWGNDSLGMLGNAAVNATNGAMAGQFSFGSKESWLDTFKRVGMGMSANASAKIIQTAGGSANADALIGATTGQITNPYLTAIFKGVDFRTFEMSFKFTPYKESDCDVIDRIIKTFRGAATPPGEGAATTAFIGYPDEFEIRYIWKGKENEYLHKFKRCVMTGIDVNYTATGQWAVMRNGFPAETNLTMRFSEIELVLRDDITKGNY